MLKSDGQPWSSQSLSHLSCEHTVEYMKGEGAHPKRFLVSNTKLGYRTKCQLNNLIIVLLLRSAPVFSAGRSFWKEQASSPTLLAMTCCQVTTWQNHISHILLLVKTEGNCLRTGEYGSITLWYCHVKT